jgi:hypothetical protein
MSSAPLPECSEVAGTAPAVAADDDGTTASSSKRQQQQQQASSSGRGGGALVVPAKPWSLAFDGSVPPSTNALASVKSRYPLDPPGYDTAIAKEPVSFVHCRRAHRRPASSASDAAPPYRILSLRLPLC